MLHHAFYPESLIREKCADLLREFPRANEYGVIEIGGVSYRSVKNWAETLSMSPATIRKRIDEAEIVGITGRDATGQIWESAFFSETDVVRVCTDVSKQRGILPRRE